MSAGSAWPLVWGALMPHGSLVRVSPATDATSLPLLCSASSRAECEFLAHYLRTSSQFCLPDSSTSRTGYHRLVSCMYPRTSADTCIPHGFRIDPACIPHVSRMYPSCILLAFLLAGCRCTYLARATEARKDDEDGEDSCRASRPAHLLEALGSQILIRYYEPMPAP